MNWFALDHATRAAVARVPFLIDSHLVGSVAVTHLPALRAFAGLLALRDDSVALCGHMAERSAALAHINTALRALGLITGWRNETYAVVRPDTLAPLAALERAASRFWGTLTFGAHATGYVAGADGRPAQIWVAQRALDKPTDPGLFDNLIGGGVAAGQTAAEALLREGFEEAGLRPDQLAHALPGSVLRLARDVPEGFQHEWLHSFDMALPPGCVPVNQDGEVAAFTLLPVADALALAAGKRMTVDAAVVTLDFAQRHGLLHDAAAAGRLQALRVAGAGAAA